MNEQSLFQATVPVFQHFVRRIGAIVSDLQDDRAATLAERLAPDTFSAGEHFQTAQGFALRTVFPLIGREIPSLTTTGIDPDGLTQGCAEVQALLADLTAADFNSAAERRIHHGAGFADLSQDASDFVTLYALPNFFFHLTMGYATLRRAGIDLGKADFDGFHVYPGGFRFPD